MQVQVSFREAFHFWLKLGFISFGGPTGQIAIMHSELVENKKWIDEPRFLHALNYCMLLPGPEAIQLAIYIGWLLHRAIGGLIAGSLFVIPSMILLWLLSLIYVFYGKVSFVADVFYGLKAAVIAIVAAAVLRIAKKALKNETMWLIAIVAFVLIFFLKFPFPVLILLAGLTGLMGSRIWPARFDHVSNKNELATGQKTAGKSSIRRAMKVVAIGLILWLTPIAMVAAFLGTNHTLFHEGLFFSKAAMVTFGGAYAVLPYVSQQAVEHYEWLSATQMMDGLGLAETTPGPLIMVVQFVGFVGAWNHPGNLPPLLAATLGSLITTWVTFVPCFLWIFLGAPHVEAVRENRMIRSALAAITAAVVGVVVNLAVWFALHALFSRNESVISIQWFLILMAAVAFAGMTKWKWGVIPVVAGSALAGLLYKAVF